MSTLRVFGSQGFCFVSWILRRADWLFAKMINTSHLIPSSTGSKFFALKSVMHVSHFVLCTTYLEQWINEVFFWKRQSLVLMFIYLANKSELQSSCLSWRRALGQLFLQKGSIAFRLRVWSLSVVAFSVLKHCCSAQFHRQISSLPYTQSGPHCKSFIPKASKRSSEPWQETFNDRSLNLVSLSHVLRCWIIIRSSVNHNMFSERRQFWRGTCKRCQDVCTSIFSFLSSLDSK